MTSSSLHWGSNPGLAARAPLSLSSPPLSLTGPAFETRGAKVTDNYYIFALNACELRLAPYLFGLCGPVGALRTTGRGVTLKLIPRPGGTRAGSAPITVETEDPYFAIHHATAFELPPSDSGGSS